SLIPSLLLRPPASALFPYTTLFRSLAVVGRCSPHNPCHERDYIANSKHLARRISYCAPCEPASAPRLRRMARRVRRARLPPSPSDRKSTRLNSSHVSISYAVFCLKK